MRFNSNTYNRSSVLSPKLHVPNRSARLLVLNLSSMRPHDPRLRRVLSHGRLPQHGQRAVMRKTTRIDS
jgi:hypothetical protein